MANIFFTSDQHWNHANILKFRDNNGQPLRPFDTVDEMNHAMVDRWNAVVKPQDKVYHLGDVAIKHKRDLEWIGHCVGHKRLIRGNHDIFPTKDYMRFFDEIYATRVFDDMILSHIPLHPESIKREWTNVHGHVHNNVPRTYYGEKYFNVCVEYTDYRPLALEELRQAITKQSLEIQRHATVYETEHDLEIAPVS
jgi:calcineurin-like phosphoesterase family protein